MSRKSRLTLGVTLATISLVLITIGLKKVSGPSEPAKRADPDPSTSSSAPLNSISADSPKSRSEGESRSEVFFKGLVVQMIDETPVIGAKIAYSKEPSPLPSEERTTVFSDEQGCFSIPCPEEIPVRLSIQSPEGHTKLVCIFEFLPRERVLIPLFADSGLKGQVVDDTTREPIPEAEVFLEAGQEDTASSSLSGTEGTFRAPIDCVQIRIGKNENPKEVLQRKTARILAEADGYVPHSFSVRLSKLRLSIPRQISLRKAASLRGIVIDKTGSPVPGAAISLVWRVEVDLWGNTSVVTTDSNGEGRFELSFPRDATLCKLLALKSEYGPGFRQLTREELVSIEEVVLEVEDRNALRGRVVDSNESAISDVRVFLDKTDDGSQFRYSQWLKACYIDHFGSPPLQATTDSDGNFLVDRIAPGTYEIRLVHFDYFQAREGLPEVMIPFSGLWVGQMELGLTISGIVIDSEGVPLPDVVVKALVQGNHHTGKVVRTGAEGAFVLGGLADESYQLHTSKKGYQHASLDAVVAGTDDALIVLSEKSREMPGKLDLLLTHRNHPVEVTLPVAVYDLQGNLETMKVVHTVGGIGRLVGLEPGAFDLVLTPRQFAPVILKNVNIRQERGEPALVELERGQPVVIKVVLPEDGEPPKAASIFESQGKLLVYPPILIDDENVLRIRQGIEGHYFVRFHGSSRDYADVPLTIDLPAPDVIEIALQFESGDKDKVDEEADL